MANLTKLNSRLLPLFFNIDQNVGANSPNLPEDVALVSFLMRASASAPSLGAKTRAICMNVAITDECTPALVQSIRDYEANWPGTPGDGHVSVVPQIGITYASSTTREHGYILAALNNDVRAAYNRAWPRIDLIQSAPFRVIELVKRVILGY